MVFDWLGYEIGPTRPFPQGVFSAYKYTWGSGTNTDKNEDCAADASLIKKSLDSKPKRGTYIFVNNRLEGNAPATILSMMERAGIYESPDEATFTNRTTFAALPEGARFRFQGELTRRSRLQCRTIARTVVTFFRARRSLMQSRVDSDGR